MDKKKELKKLLKEQVTEIVRYMPVRDLSGLMGVAEQEPPVKRFGVGVDYKDLFNITHLDDGGFESFDEYLTYIKGRKYDERVKVLEKSI